MNDTSVPADRAKPTLTIAIPTYNRARYLEELLSVLLKQMTDEPRVELIVSDNASIDETAATVKKYQGLGLRLRYIRNETNLGPDFNTMQCFEQAAGKYAWVFGDDDLILDGGLATILALLDGKEYGVAYISPFMFRRDHLAERTRDPLGRFAEIVPDGLALIKTIGAMVGFISAVIVNKDYFNKTLHPPLTDFIGGNLMQLGFICPVLDGPLPNLMVWKRLLAARTGNTSGWGVAKVFGVNLKKIADTLFHERKDIGAALYNETLQRWFPGVIMEIRRGTAAPLDAENMREVLEPVYKTNWRYWIYVYPFLVMPLPIAALWLMIIKYSNRIRFIYRAATIVVFHPGRRLPGK